MPDIKFAPELLQWKLMDFSANLRSTKKYIGGKGVDLFCKKNSKYLTFVDERGVNVGFTSSGDNKVFFQLADGTQRDILTGDLVAFGIGGNPSFLTYSSQMIGINLSYRSSPAFEWVIMDATGQGGRPIAPGMDVAISNNKVDIGGAKAVDFLVYMERPGGDIAWTTSPHWRDDILGMAKDAGRKLAEKAVLKAIRG